MSYLPSQPKIITLILIGLFSPNLVYAQPNTPESESNTVASNESSTELKTIEVHGTRLHPDVSGENQVYRRNVSSDYLSREEIERYRIDSAGDILKGLNGVYNMNTRTAGSAITPNIRGISGKGRIPVTIDGTEQTIDVWLNNYGVGDRNYVDPALFRSILVEKSPAMTRGVKSGIGGAMAIRTIEPADIIPEGQNWGVQVKTEFSDNTARPNSDLNQYLGKDYRDIPGAYADGASGIIGDRAFNAIYLPNRTAARSGTRPLQGMENDRNSMISAAFKTDMTDGLIAYSDRRKGTYFSGKNGYQGYLNNPDPDSDTDPLRHTSAARIPNMALVYRPGEEVPNSNVETRSLLLKNNWYLPNEQKITLQYMRNNIRFGEVNPFLNAMMLGFSNDSFFGVNLTDGHRFPASQGLDSKINSNTYKIGYEWKPSGSPWVDFQANVWRTRTVSTRHQSGGPDLAVSVADDEYDKWTQCHYYNEVHRHIANDPSYAGEDCATLIANGTITVPPQKADDWLSGTGAEGAIYQIFSGAEQRTTATRTGFDFSNRFRPTDHLNITLGGHLQYEKLDETNEIAHNQNDLFDIMGVTSLMTKFAGPRSGRRHEWGANLSMDWRPTDRLHIQAGVRYDKFWAFDDDTAKARGERRHPFYAADMTGTGDTVVTGSQIFYYQLMNDQEINAYQNFKNGTITQDELFAQTGIRGLNGEITEYDGNGYNSYVDASGTSQPLPTQTAQYRLVRQFFPYYNGKYQGNMPKGMFNETVHNPQGRTGEFFRYIAAPHMTYARQDLTYLVPEPPPERQLHEGETPTRLQPSLDNNYYRDWWNIYSDRYYTSENLSADKIWPELQRVKGQAWSPMIAVSYDLSDNWKLHARWAQSVRFPSIYEAVAISNAHFSTSYPKPLNFNLKPERSTSWEIGTSYNFAPLFPALRQGDVRLTYFSNTIKNPIDTTEDKRVIQYDRKISTGLELQARLDSGRFFGSLGVAYRLKQQTCDQATAWGYDPFFNRIPECIEGGLGASRFHQALLPKYSINLDLGTRLLDEKLELGVRGTYHSRVNTRQFDQLAAQGLWRILENTGRPYYWKPAVVLDAYGRYRLNRHFQLNFGIGNLTNRYYLDPLSNVPTPGPGRTITFGVKASF